MTYQWFNESEMIGLKGHELILFGAGRGSEEVLDYFGESHLKVKIVSISDNDSSYWGKTLLGHEIIPPRQLRQKTFDMILVTSISGRTSIAHQLDCMGFQYGEDYLLIGSYPTACADRFREFLNEIGDISSLQGSTLLHVGPGGFLGLETLFYAFGARKVYSIDKNKFGINYPNITTLQQDYAKVSGDIAKFTPDNDGKESALGRFSDIFIYEEGQVFLDPKKIEFVYPMDICKLSFEEKSFDYVLSFGVLEHVADSEAAVSELMRVLKPGGTCFHTIVTQDHRSFSKIEGYTPFSFRSYSTQEWEKIAGSRFYQSRILPVEWKRFFEGNGFDITKFVIREKVEIDDQMASTFHSDFKKFSLEELSQVDCTIVARKNGAGARTK